MYAVLLEGVGTLSHLSVQVLGFLILIAGTSMYNELLRGCLPGVPPPVPQDASLEVQPLPSASVLSSACMPPVFHFLTCQTLTASCSYPFAALYPLQGKEHV